MRDADGLADQAESSRSISHGHGVIVDATRARRYGPYMYSVFAADALRDDADRLEQAGPWGRLYGVRSWTDGGRLYWQSQGRAAPGVNDNMLRDFLSLADADDGRIARYAARWGALGICPHGHPASHNPGPAHGGYSGPVYWCEHMGRDEDLPDGADGYEPLEVWRRLSREAAALARIAAALRVGSPGAAGDWGIVCAHSGRAAPWWKPSRGAEWVALGNVVSEWITLGNVRPRVGVRHSGRGRGSYVDGLSVEYLGSGLFGALAMQLALVVSASRGLYSCAGCPTWFMVPPGQRKPQAGRGAYCPACQAAKVPQRRANERRKQAQASLGVAHE